MIVLWFHIPQRIHGTGMFSYMLLIFFIVNVGKYTIYMDPMGIYCVYIFLTISSPERLGELIQFD